MPNRESPAVLLEHGPQELKQDPGGGGERKRFAEVTADFRTHTAGMWSRATTTALNAAKQVRFPAGVVKIKLKAKAIAKSHRPRYLFELAGHGQVIGATAIGTLLVSVTEASQSATQGAMLFNDTLNGLADLTTIESIEPFAESDALRFPYSPEPFRQGAFIKLFDFDDEDLNQLAIQSIQSIARLSEPHLARFNAKGSRRLFIPSTSKSSISTLSAHPAVRMVWPNSRIALPTAATMSSGAGKIPPPLPNTAYPVVGVLDSGISPAVKVLSPWVQQGASFVSKSAASNHYHHGTFIAGLIAGGRYLNPQIQDKLEGPCKVLSTRIYCPSEELFEEDLVARIESSVSQHPDVKVWNLSLGLEEDLCRGPEFSPLACELDDIARRYGVLIVLAAGNYTKAPLRPWPTDTWSTDGRDLISSPGDSVLALTVASVAHAHAKTSIAKTGQPAGYSRRGPAPAMVPKPELTHFGGNCTKHNESDGHGIVSIGSDGATTSEWGTSFAAPLVAATAAHCWSRLSEAQHQATPSMVRALVVHSAAMWAPKRKPGELRYYGFGTPGSLDSIFMCDPSVFTTWHRVHIPKGQYIEHEFPMPDCLLEGGKFVGEVVITLCYEPPLDEDCGAEYCRANVKVGMGIWKKRNCKVRDPVTKKTTVALKECFRSEVPPDPKTPGKGYEAALIENGFKWSPIKVYRKKFPRGISGQRWQLRFEVLYRDGEVPPTHPQEAFAIVTVRGLKENQPVYRDGVRAIHRLGHKAYSAMRVKTPIKT